MFPLFWSLLALMFFLGSLMFGEVCHCSDDSSGGEPGLNIDTLAGFLVGFSVGFGFGCTLAFVGYLALSYRSASAEAPLPPAEEDLFKEEDPLKEEDPFKEEDLFKEEDPLKEEDPFKEEALHASPEVLEPSTPTLKGLLEVIAIFFENPAVDWVVFSVGTPLSVLILVWVGIYKATGMLSIPTALCRVVGAYLVAWDLLAFLWVLTKVFL